MASRKKLLEYAKKNKKNPTKAEDLLWGKLRGKVCPKKKVFFIRQHPIGHSFILDFYCPEAKMGIEVDGDYHWNRGHVDRWREERLLNHFDIRVLRFENSDIYDRIDDVVETIEIAIDELRIDK